MMDKMPFEFLKNELRQQIERFPKLRNSVVSIFGDLYYKQLSVEESLEWII